MSGLRHELLLYEEDDAARRRRDRFLADGLDGRRGRRHRARRPEARHRARSARRAGERRHVDRRRRALHPARGGAGRLRRERADARAGRRAARPPLRRTADARVRGAVRRVDRLRRDPEPRIRPPASIHPLRLRRPVRAGPRARGRAPDPPAHPRRRAQRGLRRPGGGRARTHSRGATVPGLRASRDRRRRERRSGARWSRRCAPRACRPRRSPGWCSRRTRCSRTRGRYAGGRPGVRAGRVPATASCARSPTTASASTIRSPVTCRPARPQRCGDRGAGLWIARQSTARLEVVRADDGLTVRLWA